MYNLERFINAQEQAYPIALEEIKKGKKRSHWMWYIFPQLKGLGMSGFTEFFGIDGIEEAQAYLENEYLKKHLIEISEELYKKDGKISNILKYPDNLKLQSSMTLFNYADPDTKIFKQILDKFYDVEEDKNTLDLLENRYYRIR